MKAILEKENYWDKEDILIKKELALKESSKMAI